jgi:formylglycine-generating enzyme required for sulfatase activity
MENKLCNAVYKQFAKAEGKAKAGTEWEQGGLAGGKRIGRADDQYPVFAVTREQAANAAKWLGGRLPTPAELDMAAGFWQRGGRNGPARGRTWPSTGPRSGLPGRRPCERRRQPTGGATCRATARSGHRRN